VDRG